MCRLFFVIYCFFNICIPFKTMAMENWRLEYPDAKNFLSEFLDSRRDLLYSTFAKKIIEPFHYRLKLSGGDEATFCGNGDAEIKKREQRIDSHILKTSIYYICSKGVTYLSTFTIEYSTGTISPSISWLNLMRYQIDLEKVVSFKLNEKWGSDPYRIITWRPGEIKFETGDSAGWSEFFEVHQQDISGRIYQVRHFDLKGSYLTLSLKVDHFEYGYLHYNLMNMMPLRKDEFLDMFDVEFEKKIRSYFIM